MCHVPLYFKITIVDRNDQTALPNNITGSLHLNFGGTIFDTKLFPLKYLRIYCPVLIAGAYLCSAYFKDFVMKKYCILGFVQEVSAYLNYEESQHLGRFLYSLANNLTDTTLREQLLNFDVSFLVCFL